MECKNCRYEFEGNYCPSCGQIVIAQHNWHTLLSSILNTLDLEKGLIYTTRQLIVNPKFIVHKYLDGATNRFTSPVKYLLTTIALLFLAREIENISLWVMFGLDLPSIEGNHYDTYLTIISMIPLVSLGFWIAFRDRFTRYVDFLIIITYFFSGVLLLLSVPLLLKIPFVCYSIGKISGKSGQIEQLIQQTISIAQQKAVTIGAFLNLFYVAYFPIRVFRSNKNGIVKILALVILMILIFVGLMWLSSVIQSN